MRLPTPILRQRELLYRWRSGHFVNYNEYG
jgi:hypothetical protein